MCVAGNRFPAMRSIKPANMFASAVFRSTVSTSWPVSTGLVPSMKWLNKALSTLAPELAISSSRNFRRRFSSFTPL